VACPIPRIFSPCIASLLTLVNNVPKFPKVLFVDHHPEGSMGLRAEIKKVEVGFEFSPVSSGNGCNNDSRMDKAWVSLVVEAKIFDQKGKEVNKKTFKFNTRKTDPSEPPDSQSGVLEGCLNKITLDLIKDMKRNITKEFAWYISIEMDDKAAHALPP
jgi:hypothetical protein